MCTCTVYHCLATMYRTNGRSLFAQQHDGMYREYTLVMCHVQPCFDHNCSASVTVEALQVYNWDAFGAFNRMTALRCSILFVKHHCLKAFLRFFMIIRCLVQTKLLETLGNCKGTEQTANSVAAQIKGWWVATDIAYWLLICSLCSSYSA